MGTRGKSLSLRESHPTSAHRKDDARESVRHAVASLLDLARSPADATCRIWPLEPNRQPKKHERHDETNDQAPRTVVGRRRGQWGTCPCARRQRRSRPCSPIALSCDVRCEWSLSFRAKRRLGPRRRSAVRHVHKEPRRRRRPAFLTHQAAAPGQRRQGVRDMHAHGDGIGQNAAASL
jgi:hypothetical protein